MLHPDDDGALPGALGCPPMLSLLVQQLECRLPARAQRPHASLLTGLDARAAAIVMRAVRNIVNTGRTIVCTIHQPSIDIFESFDELLLLKSGGRTIYAGRPCCSQGSPAQQAHSLHLSRLHKADTCPTPLKSRHHISTSQAPILYSLAAAP